MDCTEYVEMCRLFRRSEFVLTKVSLWTVLNRKKGTEQIRRVSMFLNKIVISHCELSSRRLR